MDSVLVNDMVLRAIWGLYAKPHIAFMLALVKCNSSFLFRGLVRLGKA